MNEVVTGDISAQIGYVSTGISANVNSNANENGTAALTFAATSSMPVKVQGVSGNNNAVNQVEAEDISAQMEYFSASVTDSMYDSGAGNSDAAMTADVIYNTSVEVQGVAADNNALNKVNAADISAEVRNVSLSENNYMYKYANDGASSDITSSLVYNAAVTVQGISGNNGGVNEVAATGDITAQIEYFSTNINNSMNSGSVDSGGTMVSEVSYSAPVNVQGVYGDNNAVNQVVASTISAQVQNITIYDYLNVDIANSSDSYALTYSMPITVQGVYGANNAVNAIKASEISADVGGNGYLVIQGNHSIMPYDDGGTVSIVGDIPITVAGVYGDTGAVNDITASSIAATAALLQQMVTDYDGEQVITPSSVNVYGIYGARQSTTNIHSEETGGTVEISVGISQDSSSGAAFDLTDVNTYGMYLENAAVNLYDNVNVTGQTVPSGTALEIEPITYLQDADVIFAGYDDYYDPYYYDAVTGTYGKTITGSGTFHTYTSSTGTLELQGSSTFTVNTDLVNNQSDKLSFAALSNESSGTNYIAVATDPSILQNAKGTITGKTVVIEITDAEDALTASGNQFIFDNSAGISTEVTFEGKSFAAEGPLRMYEITPTVETEADGDSKNVIITAINYDTTGPSEGLKTAGDAQLAMRNIGRVENSTLMQRMGELRTNPQEAETGVWAKFTRGEFDADAAYGRKFNQDYNQFSLGYDWQKDRDNEKIITGVAISYLYGDTGYVAGSGEAKSTALSIYRTWFGDKGHYLDLVAKAGHLNNSFDVVDSGDNKISADYSANAYSLSAEYGYRKQLSNSYFVEPQAQLSLGRIQSTAYNLSNGVTIKQGSVNSAVVRLGVLAGRQYKDGNAYIKAAVLRDLGGSGSVTGYYDADSLSVATTDNDTWYEVGIGANAKMSKRNNLYFDLIKTFGGDVTQKWQVNVGSRWTF